MKISLICATTSRYELVRRFAEGLRNQNWRDFELILVHDSAQSLEAQSFAKDFAGKFPLLLVPSEIASASRKRNFGLGKASGEIVAFPDDDCAYFPDTLARVRAAFGDWPELEGILGRRVELGTSSKQEPCPRFPKWINSVYAAFRNSETYLQFYRRIALEKVGGFDESLGPGLAWGSGEDTDLVLRAYGAKLRLAHLNDVLVAHPAVIPAMLADTSPGSKIERYASGRMRLLRKHDMPWYFVAGNILYPLLRMPLDLLGKDSRAQCSAASWVKYRMQTFKARLKALNPARMAGDKA